MGFDLSPRQWQEIHEFQAREMKALVSDAQFAREAAMSDHYSRIGAWITPEHGKRVLELGCGPGRYVALLANLGFDVVGADPCAAASLPTWDMIKAHRNVEFLEHVYAEDLPFEDGSFDQLACLGALLYFNDPAKALAEMRRVLKPGGRMIVRTVNRHNLYRLVTGRNLDPSAPNAYTMSELVEVLQRGGFTVHERFSYGFYPPFFRARWWHLVNGVMSRRSQDMWSTLTPSAFRVNLVAFCSAA